MISEILRRAKNEVKKTFMDVEDYRKLKEGEHDVLSRYNYSISELNDLISELEATQWIPVSEGLPENESDVDLWVNGRRLSYHYTSGNFFIGYPTTTHWRYAPQPPKE